MPDCNEAIRLDPQLFLAWNNRCGLWFKQGENDRAMADCNEAIRLNPEFSIAYSNRGMVSESKGDLAPALNDFKSAIRLDPKRPDALKAVERVESKIADKKGR